MRTRCVTFLGAIAMAVALVGAPTAAEAKTLPPALTALRCVPKTLSTCKNSIRLTVGQKLQLSGHRFSRKMRVSFRWSKGALATTLSLSKVGWTAVVPPGTALGAVAVTVSDKAGRRSNKLRITVISPPSATTTAPVKVTNAGLPAAFGGDGMWIWYIDQSEKGDLAAIAARAHAAGMNTVFVKSADGSTTWKQFTPALVASLHALGLKVCAWQFVYGDNPTGEAGAAANSVAAGADCFVIDAESKYEGRYAAAQTYMATLRAAIGAAYPVGLTSFPYVDYHPRLPYSVFLGPGGAQVNLPQVYWKDIGASVDAVSAKTYANNRIYQVPIAPLGQTYNNVSADDLTRFRAIWAGYGSTGLSWWDWQETTSSQWDTLDLPGPATITPTDPGWPALSKGSTGDEVIWLEQHLAAADPSVIPDATFTSATTTSLKAFQAARGLPESGVSDAATWQALLTLTPVAVDYS